MIQKYGIHGFPNWAKVQVVAGLQIGFHETLPNSPRMDLYETDQGYEVVVDLPGIESSSDRFQNP